MAMFLLVQAEYEAAQRAAAARPVADRLAKARADAEMIAEEKREIERWSMESQLASQLIVS